MPPPELDLHDLMEPSKQLCQIWIILILQKEKRGSLIGKPANVRWLGGSRLCMPLKHVQSTALLSAIRVCSLANVASV